MLPSMPTESACTVLSVDQTVKNPKSEQHQQEQRKKAAGGMLGRGQPGRGRGMMPRK
jgi:hypothetical protein